MRERLPSRSLALLNEAMLRQRDDRRFCTVAYAYLEPMPRAPVHLRQRRSSAAAAAAGGRTAVQAVGEPGSLLGVLPDRASRTGRCRSRRATRSCSTPTE